MTVITKKLAELRDADVTHVSLVDRSASRIPFRILKRDQENQMGIDLTSLSRAVKGDKPVAPPTISAVVVMDQPEAIMAQVTKSLEAAGFAVDKVTKNDDGTVMFAQTSAPMEGATVVKMSDELLVVCKGFEPYSQKLHQDGSFDDKAAANGFHQGLRNATDTLHDQIHQHLATSDSPEEASKKITSTLGDFSKHVKTMSSALPAHAFKADLYINEVVAKADKGVQSVASQIPTTAPKGFTQNDWDEMTDDGKLAALSDSGANNSSNEGANADPVDGGHKINVQSPEGTGGKKPNAMHTTDKEPAAKNAPAIDGNNTVKDPADLATESCVKPEGFAQNEWEALSDDGKKTVAQLAQDAAKWQHANPPAAGMTAKEEDVALCDHGITIGKECKKCDGGTAMKSDPAVAAAAVAEAAKKAEDDRLAALFGPMQATMQALADAIKTQGEQLTGVVAKVDDVVAKQEEHAKVIDSAVRKSETAVNAIRNTVATPEASVEQPAIRSLDGIPVKKADQNAFSGTFDTGFMSRAAVQKAQKRGK